MKNSSKKRLINILVIYRYFMPFLTTICLFILPSFKPRSYFKDSFSVDLTVRCVLWLIFTFIYWSLPTGMISIMKNKKIFYVPISKDFSSFISIMSYAIIFGIFICFFTWWALSTFVPQFYNVQNMIAVLNGLMCAAIAMLQYYIIPENWQNCF
jgi:hypothetical protein